MDIRKATRQDLKRHNRLSLLRSVYYGIADNRAALSVVTGLTKPTVSELTAELIEEGYLAEVGTGGSTEAGGKPPRLLSFIPDARQVIGISVDGVQARAMLVNLAGEVAVEHHTALDGMTGTHALDRLIESINALVAQLDAPLLGLGVGVPGLIEREHGRVRRSSVMGWYDVPLAHLLKERFECACVVSNNTELAALAQVAGNANRDHTEDSNRVTLLINGAVEVGVTVRGAEYHHGGDIGQVRALSRSGSGTATLAEVLGWPAIVRRVAQLRAQYPSTRLPADGLKMLHIRYAAALGDPAGVLLLDELAEALASAVVWSIALLNPSTIVLAGKIADLGEPLLDRLRYHAAQRLSVEDVALVRFACAQGASLSARGASVLAAYTELGIL
ncbi:MAG: ROK family protein [Anaerolineae bacterium]|nr:ROK family protein [Anaerolineae bacterium]